MDKKYSFEDLLEIMEKLRSEDGCPWDREQTHESIKRSIMEEGYELIEAIDGKNPEKMADESGDLLLQVVFHAQIGKEQGEYDISDVTDAICKKLIHRHPHVFGNVKVNSTKEILDNWDKLKAEEKKHRKSAMDGISKAQSALMSAQKISKKAVKTGFEWPDEKSLYDCIYSEFEEFKEAEKQQDKEHMEEEFGDILFATVNLARWNKIDAEQALLKANKKFVKRFRKMEELAEKPLEEYSFEEYDALWKLAKKQVG